MEIRTTYKGITQEGVKGIWCGFCPDDITVTEEIPVLYPDNGKLLKNKANGELLTSVILQNETEINNYEEIIEETTEEVGE